jgi:acyl carrier protein
VSELKQRILKQTLQETELLIDPEFFRALKEHYAKISDVRVRLERGREHNELNKFRYSALLSIGGDSSFEADYELIDGRGKRLAEIQDYLRERQPQSLFVSGLVNARLAADIRGVELLFGGDGEVRSVEALRDRLQEVEREAVDPEEIWEMAEELGYKAEVCWSQCGEDRLDAAFAREGGASLPPPPPMEPAPHRLPLNSYANNPLRSKQALALIPQLRGYLRERLPEYMIPAGFVLLEKIPHLPNGKVDRRTLATTGDGAVAAKASGLQAMPETEMERAITAVVEQALSVEKVGVESNFFDIGANSIRIVQINRKLKEALGKDIPVVEMFKNPTIRSLAKYLGESPGDGELFKQVGEQAQRRKVERQRRLMRKPHAQDAVSGSN